MTKEPPIFNVIIASNRITLKKVKPGRPGYASAAKKVILRRRDAIELFQRLKKTDKPMDGVFSFQHLDTAKDFAMLFMEAEEQRVQDNLDRIQAFDGSTASSDG